MKRILFVLIMLVGVAYGQSYSDKADVKSDINTKIITNASRSITAAQLNKILQGLIHYNVDTIYTNATMDTLFFERDSIVNSFKIGASISGKLNISDTANMLLPYFREVGYGLFKSGHTVYADTSSTHGLVSKDRLNTAISGIPTSQNISNADLTSDGDHTLNVNNHVLNIDSVGAFSVTTKTGSGNAGQIYLFSDQNFLINSNNDGSLTYIQSAINQPSVFNDGTTSSILLRAIANGSISQSEVDISERYIKLLSDSIFIKVVNGFSGTEDSALVRDATTGQIGMMKIGVSSSSFVFNETPSGTVNGSNVTFTTSYTPTSGTVRLYNNGIRLGTGEYSVSGSTITFTTAPLTGDNIVVDYLK